MKKSSSKAWPTSREGWKITSKQGVSAVIDRIVDGITAVLLLEEEKIQLNIPLVLLPAGSREGQWLFVQMEDGEFRSAKLDPGKTQNVKERISNKCALLLERMAKRDRDH